MMTLDSYVRKIAGWLIAHAARILPAGRSEWARAMQFEIDFLDDGFAALCWALGCVSASYVERINVMKIGNLKISRVIFTFEMLMCFGPVTVGLFSLFWPGLNVIPSLNWFLFLLSIALIGPIGLIVAFRLIILGRTSMKRIMIIALCVPALWSFIGCSIFTLNTSNPGDGWRELILLAILPVVGIGHLIYMMYNSGDSANLKTA